MKLYLTISFLFVTLVSSGQALVNTTSFNKNGKVKLTTADSTLRLDWPAGNNTMAAIVIDLARQAPLIKSMYLAGKKIAASLDPAFVLSIGKRDLVSQNGWNIFFDKVPNKPHQSYKVQFKKTRAVVATKGTHTVVRLGSMQAGTFNGALEITLYEGSPLLNISAVLSTNVDSTAILYDAGLLARQKLWNRIGWSNTEDQLQYAQPNRTDSSKNLAVKYRTIIGENAAGSLAVFPAPHQYFYPLDEAFNLRFTWYGNNYREMLDGFGLGIRQDLLGDKRFVPWFNAPPGTQQRLNFFCLLNTGNSADALAAVKKFTHNDTYVPLKGFKTMTSHYHNEFVMKVVRAGKPVPAYPEFKDVFKKLGVDVVHLGEFHYTAHPKGPDITRLAELHDLFEQCRRLSDPDFLLLPGEEPNEFLGGHWMQMFPKPVYWIMSRKPEQPFQTVDPVYGKVYRVSNKDEMLRLLQLENGLAWTAHARTKGSTGFPDAYKNESFFTSPYFMGAAWKAMPADLSQPRLGKRVLDLLDDMNNWGLKKTVIGEADLFTVTHENEMYAHHNVNYLQLDTLPAYAQGWAPVTEAMQKGMFFTTTGEVLLPEFTINGTAAGETLTLPATGKARIQLSAQWTFPLNFAEIISGDGNQVFRQKIDLSQTTSFGEKQFLFEVNLKNRKWVRIEVWDVAANGAFTQTVYLQ